MSGDSTENSQEKSLRKSVRAGLLWTFSGGGAVAILRIGTLVVLARLLTPVEFGLMTASLIVVKLSGVFVYMGIGPAIVQLVDLDARHRVTGVLASTVFSVVVQVIVWVFAPTIANFFDSVALTPILRAISFVFLFRGVSTVSASLLNRELRFKDLAKYDVLSYLFGFALVSIVLAAFGAGAWALAFGYLANAGVFGALCMFARPPDWGTKPSWEALSELLRFGTGVTLARIAAYFANTADNIVVGRFLGVSALGFYGRAYGLMSSAETLTGGLVDKVFFPAIARVQADRARLRKGFHDGQSAIALGILPVSVFLVVMAPETVLVLLGRDWVEVIPLFQILAAGLLFQTGYGIAMSVIRGTGAVYKLARIQTVYALCVGGGALIGQKWGLEGVAAGILVAMLCGYLVAARATLVITGHSWRDFLAMHKPGLLGAASVATGSLIIATGMRWIDAPAVIVLVGTLAVVSVTSGLLMRQTIARLLGTDPLIEIRSFLASRASAA